MNNNDRLKILREETKMDFISIIRVYKECKKAEYLRNMCELNDSKHTYSADYTNADELEYDIRMKILKEKLMIDWQRTLNTSNVMTLDEFVENFLYKKYINNTSIKTL